MIHDATLKTISFRRQAEKILVFIQKYFQKLTFGRIALHVFKKIFLILLFSCIVFFKTVDNESICGDVGENEIHCFFSKSYTDGEGHVCIQCPCNTVVLSSLPEIPGLIYNSDF